MPPKEGRATLATIAAAAGVSVATVSKVLNGRTDVAPATRGLVETLLRQHNYVGRDADSTRRSLAATRPTIEVVFGGDLRSYSSEVLQGVLDGAADFGVAVVVSIRPRGQRGPEAESATAWARELASAGRRAVIAVVNDLTAGEATALSRARIPLVVIDPLSMPPPGVTSVGSANFTGGLAATTHLLSLGHRRIAYIGGPPTSVCNQARLHGYRAAMDAAGVPVSDEYVRPGQFRHEDGLAQGAALLDLGRRPTAVFAGSDEAAAGLLEAARTRGVLVPEDLSVVGFDDSWAARLVCPPLTTVRQPLPDMGKLALRTALRMAAGEKLDSNRVELATELVVRQSTAPPRSDTSAQDA